MLRILLSMFFGFFLSIQSFSLNPGDLMFVGFDADSPDGFAIVALVEIPNSTTVSFFDKDGAGQIDWTTNSVVSSGTVIIFQSVQNSSVSVNIGSVSRTAGFQITGDDEAIVAKEGFTCLAAIRNDMTAPLPASCGSLSAAYIVSSSLLDEDVMIYKGSTVCNTTLAACQAMIINTSNWETEDGSGDQSQDGGADFPTCAPMKSCTAVVPVAFSGLALPVEIVSFEGLTIQSYILLNWMTATEINNDYFQVEHRIPNSKFAGLGIGKIPGNGNTLDFNHYKYYHRNPVSGLNYYRLKQVDFDGSFTYSKTISVYFGEETATRLYPTIADDQVFLERPEKVESASTIQLFNLAGQLLQSWNYEPDELRKTLEVSNLQPGNYFVKILNGPTVETLRFVKM